MLFVFFFSSRRRHTRWPRDWSSDVCLPIYSFFQALVIPLETEPVSVTRQMEASNIEQRTWVEDARFYPDTGDALQMLRSEERRVGKEWRPRLEQEHGGQKGTERLTYVKCIK